MDLERVAFTAARECIRQEVGLHELASLLDAYNFSFEHDYLDHYVILSIAGIVDKRNKGYRKIPVTFKNGGSAASPDSIFPAMDRLISCVKNVEGFEDLTYEWVKAFLSIHPFIDGNGRTAWVLYNWLMHKKDYPNPLPDFKFGE